MTKKIIFASLVVVAVFATAAFLSAQQGGSPSPVLSELVATANSAQVDYFLKIDGIDGEATDNGHKDWINLLSVSNGITRPGGSTSGAATFEPIVIHKRIDKASPKLMEAIATGEHLDEAIIEIQTPGRSGQYIKITMEDVIISSFSSSGSQSDVPTEEVAFYYNKIKFEYSNREGEVTEFAWDIQSNTPWR